MTIPTIVSKLKYRQKLQTRCITDIVDCCGIREGMVIKNFISYKNDLFYFAISKACKSLKASRLLYDLGFYEDCIVLIRSAYESYLLSSYSLNNDISDVIKLTVINPILNLNIYDETGKYIHQSQQKAGKKYKYIKIKDLSISTRHCDLDKKIHEELYGYLCEHTHPNFITSFHYQNINYPLSFSCTPQKVDYPRVLFLSVFVANLLLGEIIVFEDLDPEYIRAVKRHILGGIEIIQLYLYSVPDVAFPEMFLNIWERSKLVLQDYLKNTYIKPTVTDQLRIDRIFESQVSL